MLVSHYDFFKQKTAYEIGVRLVGSEMCIRDRLSIEITTGMSAPPIGIIIKKPRAKAITVIQIKAVQLVVSLKKNHKPNPIIARAMIRLTICCPLNVIGEPPIRPDNFRNAITDPDQVLSLIHI